MGRGRLIVLEGVDGAGTSTQSALLCEALQAKGYPTHQTREPSDGPVGMLIRQILSRRIVVPSPTGFKSPRMETMALLFAADRLDHLESEMLPNLADGIAVVCDRYVHSSVAYQTLTASPDDPDAQGWVQTVNSRARRPDLTLILDVSAETAARRRARRGGVEEIYESTELQRRLVDFYSELPKVFPDEPMVVVDGERGVDEVHASCLAAALALHGERG
jgi:dTMP kinase